VESSAPAKQRQAALLLTYLLERKHDREQQQQHHHKNRSAFRLGIAGPPGAGKSTFIEALGRYILSLPLSGDNDEDKEPAPAVNNNDDDAAESSNLVVNDVDDDNDDNDDNDQTQTLLWRPHQMAVLCVDPSSALAGGSILGDKTRMPELTKSVYAYIRPSPTGMGRTGGLAAYTDDVVTLCEQAGYELILLETVGLGQSEQEVIQSVDMMILLIPPAGGDDLQGVVRSLSNVLIENQHFVMFCIVPSAVCGITVVGTCARACSIAARLFILVATAVDMTALAHFSHAQPSILLSTTEKGNYGSGGSVGSHQNGWEFRVGSQAHGPRLSIRHAVSPTRPARGTARGHFDECRDGTRIGASMEERVPAPTAASSRI
jgi:DNA polymerase III delta prime subunit